MPDPIVVLSIAGQNWFGWQEIRIRSAITQISSEFTLKLTDKWSEEQKARPIKEGESCVVTIDNKPVVTGYIDDASPSYDANNHGIEVSGRDATGDLVDCSAPSFQWKGRSLLKGAQELCTPFGIDVTSFVDVSKPFQRMKSDEGETVFEVIESAARIRGVLLMSDGIGGLIISRAGTRRLSGRLELGVNIKQGSNKRSMRDRFSQYTVKGQSDNPFSDSESAVSAKVNDKAVTRYRPKVILAEDGVDIAGARDRAIWHRNMAAAKSNSINYVINGWHLNGQLLRPNVLVAVKDTYLNFEGELLIVAVTLLLDGNGLRAELELAHPKMFDLLELPEPNDDGAVF